MKKLVLLLVIFLTACATSPQPLATPIASRFTLSSNSSHDCNGGLIAGVTIKGANIRLSNCVIIPTSGMGIQITDSSFVTISNVTIQSSVAEGSGIDIAASSDGSTHDITIQDCNISGPMGWGISGSEHVLKNITVKRCSFDGIGASGGSQKHAIYVNNWQGFTIEDVTITKPWNMGIKVVGNVTDGAINRVTINGAGRSGVSGHGIGLGEGVRVSNFQRLVISNCDIENSKDSGIDAEYAKNSTVTVTGCKLINNYYAIQIGATGNAWTVTDNVGYNALAVQSRPPLYVGAIGSNKFDYNNWYHDGYAPITVSGKPLSFAQWQALGQDLHGISKFPSEPATPTNTPTITPTASPTVTVTTTPTITTAPTAKCDPALDVWVCDKYPY